MSWLRAWARLLAGGMVLSPAPPVDDALPSKRAVEQARQAHDPPRELPSSQGEGTVEGEGLRQMRGRVESVEPSAGGVRVRDALGGRSLTIGRQTLVVTPRGPGGVESVIPGDEVRATFDARGRVDVLEVLPPAREEAPGRPTRLPRITPGAPNPSAPDPRSDRAPGDVPGNHIPRRMDGD